MKAQPCGLVFVLLLLAASTVHANLLRSTHDQCVAALGQPITTETQPVPPATEAYEFRDEEWRRIIQFWHGKAHAISFARRDGSPITATELLDILHEFSDGKRWDKDERGTYWRSDGQILGVRGKHNELLLLSAEFAINVSTIPW